MPGLLSVNQICERALRKIGSFSINDVDADGVETEEARIWLDMLVGHVASRKRTWWLVPDTETLTLVDGQKDYLLATIGAGPAVQHVVNLAAVNQSSGAREDIEILRRQEWEALNQEDTGDRPTKAFIDRENSPTLYLYPTPVDPIGWDVAVTYQKFTDDSLVLDPTSAVPDVRSSWNLYLVTALAAQLGNGPVRKLPQDEVRDMQQEAKRLLDDLEAFDEGESPGVFRRTAYNDF